MSSFKKAWWIALAIKAILAICLPLANDEAYYWVWGHHPQLSYFDHPPMVGWLFSIGTLFESFGNAARLPGVLVGHLTILIWSEILSPFLDDAKKRLWLFFVLFSPFLGLGSLIQTPDVPFLFFWSLSLLLFTKLLKTQQLSLYAAFGASLGLGFCSKYLIVVFVPVSLLWLAISGDWKKVKWLYVPITIATGLICCLPVLIWNAQHDWVSFAFQFGHGLGAKTKDPMWPVQYLLGQIGILFPTTAFFALQRREPKEARFLHAFGWLPLLFFFSTSFRARVEGNWPSMAHPALLSLAFLNAPLSKWLRGTAALWAIATTLIFTQVISPWIPLSSKSNKLAEFTRFDVLLPYAKEHPDLFMSSYQMAGAVSYKMRRQYYKLEGMNRRDFYDFTPQSRPKSDTFWIAAGTGQSLPDWVTEAGYQIKSDRSVSDDFRVIEVQRKREVERSAQSSDRECSLFSSLLLRFDSHSNASLCYSRRI